MKKTIARVLRKLAGVKQDRRSHPMVTPLTSTRKKFFEPVGPEKTNVHPQ